MNNEQLPSSGADRGWNMGFLLRFAVIVGAFVLLLVVLGYLNTRLESIEDQLKFRPPTPGSRLGKPVLPEQIAREQTVYVPVYSHIFSSGGKPFLVEATLSVRNTELDAPITIISVRYYNSKGKLIDNYLKKPLRLEPLESTEFLVKKQDTRGGVGANFIVVWVAETNVNEPIIEAIMVGISESYSISFMSSGRALRTISKGTDASGAVE